jgi:chitodextrinase
MMWELSQDAVGTYSLLSAIHDEVIANGGGGNGNQLPTVSITSPAANASFTAPATVTINVTASDADGSIAKVEFYNGATKLGEDNSSPYTYSWANVAAGSYSLSAKATDDDGAVTTSATIPIVVNGTGGNSCSGIAAWSASSVYTNANQVVYNNKLYTAKWWTQNEQPDINSGDAKPWAYVRDCSGGGGNALPVVSITSPANNATFNAPASIAIQANATDSDGSIAKVEFFNGGSKLGEDASAPYSFTWANVAAGTYTLTAKATDNANGAATSAAVTVTVGTTGGGNCASVPAYEPYPRIYNRGDRVVYNGVLYESQSDALYNVTPGTADWWWKSLGACTGAALAATNSVAVQPAAAVRTLTVYPNPVTGSTVQVEIKAAAVEKIYIDVWGVNGSSPVLHREYVTGGKGGQFISVDVSQLPPGTWIIKASDANGAPKGSAKIIRM